MATPTKEDEMQARMNAWCGTFNVDYISEERGLSNLFKYAVPKVDDYIMHTENGECLATVYAYKGNGKYGQKRFEGKDKDPALALFWALDKVRND